MPPCACTIGCNGDVCVQPTYLHVHLMVMHMEAYALEGKFSISCSAYAISSTRLCVRCYKQQSCVILGIAVITFFWGTLSLDLTDQI
jgi:hypothetical protein